MDTITQDNNLEKGFTSNYNDDIVKLNLAASITTNVTERNQIIKTVTQCVSAPVGAGSSDVSTLLRLSMPPERKNFREAMIHRFNRTRSECSSRNSR